jgi:hypothetical protein
MAHCAIGFKWIQKLKGDFMRRLLLLLYGLILSILFVISSHASAVFIPGVPEYTTTYGCAATAAAEIMGYYDQAGYGNLMAGAGWSGVSLTSDVQPEVALLANSLQTISGRTLVSNIDTGITGYAADHGYQFTSVTLDFREFSWLDYTGAIDSGRPVLMSVDSDGNWNCDHAVASIGYDDRGAGGLWYGFYTGWQETESIQWAPFAWAVFNDQPWGISFASFITPCGSVTQSVPEPDSMLMLFSGIVMLLTFWKKR